MSNRYGIRDIVDVEIVDITTKKPILFLESLKTSSTEVGAAVVVARGGRGNPRRIVWEGDKDVTFNCEDCMISPTALSLLLGSTLVTGVAKVPVVEILTSASDALTLSATPLSGDATRPLTIYSTSDRSTPETEYTLGSISNPNEYTIAARVVSLPSTTADGDIFLVSYYKNSTALNKQVTITSDQFAGTFKLTGYTLFRNESDGKDYPARITIPKAKLLSPITLTQAASGDPSIFPWKFIVLKSTTSSTMVIYDIETDTPIS